MKKRRPAFKILNRKRIIILLSSIVLISAAGYGQFWLRRASVPQIFGEAVLSVNTSEKVFALTFDDGPNPESTEEILNILAKYEAISSGAEIKDYVAFSAIIFFHVLLLLQLQKAIMKEVCTKCPNFSCALNKVPQDIKVKYIKNNPVMKDAWEKAGYKIDE